MIKALVWKEWRQLALVRWGGIALGALLPAAFVAGAELSQRGLLPTGRVTGYAPRDLMFELLPAALAIGVWPLIGLMAVAQAYAGDRASGTEVFVLERPVPRSTAWSARLLAALATVAMVVAGTGSIAAGSAAITGAPPGIGWSRFAILMVIGAGVAVLAVLGGLVASSVLTSPMGSVLFGAVLGSVPVALAAELMFFRYARIGGVTLGAAMPALLLPGYVASSWFAVCRGEPAGRGRVRRAATVLAAVFGGVVVLFVVLAFVVVRANALAGEHSVAPSPNGRTAYLASQGVDAGGWIVDVATGAKRAFVASPVDSLAWAPDGSEVALLTWSGPLGSVRTEQRLDFRSTADGHVARSIAVGSGALVHDLAWAESGLVVVISRFSANKAGEVRVEIVDPGAGTWRPTGFWWKGWPVNLVGPDQNGHVFVLVAVGGGPADGPNVARGHRLFPVDVTAARVGPPMLDDRGLPILFAGWQGGLSPGGRFARVVSVDRGSNEPRLVDLRSGEDQPGPQIPLWAVWTAGERLAWHDDRGHDTRLFVETPGMPPQVVRAWRDAQVGVTAAPGGGALFISAIPAGGAPVTDTQRRPPDVSLFAGDVPSGVAPEELVYFPDEGRFASVGRLFSDRPHDHRYTQWAGPRTLARIAPGVVYLEDIDHPGALRFVIGGPGDLE
jgi:hypothetical protein